MECLHWSKEESLALSWGLVLRSRGNARGRHGIPPELLGGGWEPVELAQTLLLKDSPGCQVPWTPRV